MRLEFVHKPRGRKADKMYRRAGFCRSNILEKERTGFIVWVLRCRLQMRRGLGGRLGKDRGLPDRWQTGDTKRDSLWSTGQTKIRYHFLQQKSGALEHPLRPVLWACYQKMNKRP